MSGSGSSTLHDPPDPGQLVQAVAELLEQWLAEATPTGAPGQMRFHLRVAAKTLRVVERQLALASDQERAHLERLRSVGAASDADLAAAIRSGELDDRYLEVAGVLREAVWDKVKVVNPGYVGAAGGPFDRPAEPCPGR